MSVLELRKEIDDLVASGVWRTAYRRLGELWRLEKGQAASAFISSRCVQLCEHLGFTPYRLTILRSFTVEPVVGPLRAAAWMSGIDLQVKIGDFNAYSQEILDPDSLLYRSSADAIILAVQSRDVAPDLWSRYADLPHDAIAAATERTIRSYRQWVHVFRERSAASLIVHNLEQPNATSLGVIDAQSGLGQRTAFESVNGELRKLAGEHRGVFILDYDSLVARFGRTRWHDERKWLTARMPIAADLIGDLAHEWLRFIVPLAGKTAKALIVDLDNTLWGGVIGEDGITGIKLGTEYPGASYQSLQRALLDQNKKGILLAICSKNNYDDAMEALTHHPGMVLRPEHFAAIRINWQDKAQNLREIAAELNIGIDSLAFLDDNPVERESIRTAIPEVMVIDLPQEPIDYAMTVRDCPAFERLTLSSEDHERTALYAAERERSKAEEAFTTKEDFFRFLEQEAEISPVAPETLARVAQLTHKTNQFNLTTRRYTEQEISSLAARTDTSVVAIRVRDRYGDHGLVGVAIARDVGVDCEVDTFLLSCRVIGRTVETALLAHLVEQARLRGRRRLLGRFLPTKKNVPARDFYPNHGFRLEKQNGDGSLWILDLDKGTVPFPEWIRLNLAAGGRH